jgi:Kef-type K+ transport system membrane component KefB
VSLADVFHEVAALLVLAAAAGALAVWLRQPLIVAFIAVGVLAGPSALGVVSESDEIDLLAELGIALLLFAVGLKLDVRLIRSTGPVALIAGFGQMAFTAGTGFALALVLGLDLVTAAYVALALTFSSTIIVVKLLSDQRELDELHGRIAVGILIVQDIAVVLAMIGLTAIGPGGQDDVPREVLLVVLKGALLLAGVALAMRFVLTPALHRVAHLPELLLLSAIALGIGLAAVGDLLGFSREVGAFLAGVALASTPYRDAIGGRLVPLRDFLLLFFFVDLGIDVDLGGLDGQLATAAVLSLFVFVAKPLVVMAITGALGYRKRVGFLTGVTLAQISEFSLILAALGVSLGHLDDRGLALIATVGLITISGSTYGINYSHALYSRLERWLGPFERDRPPYAGDDGHDDGEGVDMIVWGLGRYGRRLADGLIARGHRVMGVDYDPRAVEEWRATGHPALYGDLEDPELPASLPLDAAAWVVSSVPRRDANVALLDSLHHHGYRGRVAVTAYRDDDARELRGRGADAVLHPFRAAAEQAVATLDAAPDGEARRSVADRPGRR